MTKPTTTAIDTTRRHLPTKDVTERDDLTIAMALAYAIECVNRLPEEWREVRWFTTAGDAVDQRDMERLLISLRGGQRRPTRFASRHAVTSRCRRDSD
jgi:hypothetical protein